MATIQIIDFSNTQGQITPQSEVGSTGLKFELIRDVMDVLVTSKNKEDPHKNEGARVVKTLNIDFSVKGLSAVKGRIWLKFELIRDVMAILVTSKYEDDPIKLDGARVATTQIMIFQTLKGN